MKQNHQYVEKMVDANLTHIQKLNLKLYHHTIDLIRLYAYASGKKVLKKSSKKRSVEDERRLLWSVKSMREQMKKIEDEVKSFVDKYL